MANTAIQVDYNDITATVYVLTRNSVGQVNIVAGNTFQNYAAASIATYITTTTLNGDGGKRKHYPTSSLKSTQKTLSPVSCFPVKASSAA